LIWSTMFDMDYKTFFRCPFIVWLSPLPSDALVTAALPWELAWGLQSCGSASAHASVLLTQQALQNNFPFKPRRTGSFSRQSHAQIRSSWHFLKRKWMFVMHRLQMRHPLKLLDNSIHHSSGRAILEVDKKWILNSFWVSVWGSPAGVNKKLLLYTPLSILGIELEVWTDLWICHLLLLGQ